MPRTTTFLLALAATLMAGFADVVVPVRAQAPMPPNHTGMEHGTTAAPSPAGQGDHQEMMAVMERMNHAMMAPQTMTGDPDRDLVAMMLPHHQGAIDMARIYLRTGRDPQIRRMAQKIIADQEREIREMRAWQARHPASSR